ncbi:MAG: leucine-rich repeat domain-containing protein [Oscillospiraceae bacterium]|nr:leucine-rich repeat domain-containing protein [Oscillospiraceae bacterium]
MNNRLKRSLAIVLAVTALCTPVSTSPVLKEFRAEPIVASAADFLSGLGFREFSYESSDHSYTLYFAIKDRAAKTATLTACCTHQSGINLTIPETVRCRGVSYQVVSIGLNAFNQQNNINTVKVPKTVTELSTYAFSNCRNLTSIDFAQVRPGYGDYALRIIGGSAFMNCEKLQSTDFLNNVTEIAGMAFKNCKNINFVYAPKLTYLGANAFSGCSKLNFIDLTGSTITEIPNSAFADCCSAISSDYEWTFRMPSTVTKIGNYAFQNVQNIRKINLSNVTSIGEGAFMDCSKLNTVLTCDNLSFVGERAFYGCNAMDYFVCKNDNVSLGSQAVGYMHSSLYTGKMPSFNLWGKTNNSTMASLARDNHWTYRKTSDAPALASERYKDYEWQKANTSYEWGKNKNYYFNNSHRPYANGYYGQTFNGICSGMAIVSALTSSGYLSVSDYAPGFNKISDVLQYGYIPNNTISYVTTVWANSQNNSSYDYSVNATFDKETLLYTEYITYGADAAVMDIRPQGVAPGTPGHAVVCFGMEYKNDASDKNNACWNGWDARLMIYDVNNYKMYGPKQDAAHKTTDYVYVRFSDGRWTSQLANTYGNGLNNTSLKFTHSYKKMMKLYSMTANEFFAAIRN